MEILVLPSYVDVTTITVISTTLTMVLLEVIMELALLMTTTLLGICIYKYMEITGISGSTEKSFVLGLTLLVLIPVVM